MTAQLFLILLSIFSVATSITVEALKRLFKKIKNYDVLACITALIVGGGGTLVYYQLAGITFTANNVIYAILMGFASALCAMVGYDKVVQAIEQFRK